MNQLLRRLVLCEVNDVVVADTRTFRARTWPVALALSFRANIPTIVPLRKSCASLYTQLRHQTAIVSRKHGSSDGILFSCLTASSRLAIHAFSAPMTCEKDLTILSL